MGAVLSLFDPVAAIVGQVIGTAASFIVGALTGMLWWIPGVQEFMFDYILEPIFKFLGFHDEDIYQVRIIAVKVFDDELYSRTQLKLATEYMKKESKDALWYATNFAATGDAQFDKYYRFGKWYYLDYLPEIQITCTTVRESEVKAILRALHNDSDVFIDEIGVMTPFDDDWCKWRLQEVYGYNVGDDYLVLNGKYYYYGGCSYNANTNNFTVTLSAMTAIKERVEELVDATATGTDTVTINTYQVVEEERYDATQMKVTTYTRTKYEWAGTVVRTEETPKIITYRTDSTASDSVTETLTSTTTGTYDKQRIVVTQRTTRSSVNTGIIISQTSSTVSDTETIVLDGHASNYHTETVISETDVPTGWTDITTTVGYHNNIRQYIAKYSSLDSGKSYIWIYNTTSGTYPALANPVNQIQGLEGYPICMLRNGFNDITNYNGSGQYGHSKPPSINEHRYKSTKELLSAIGIDLDSVIDGYTNNPDVDKLQNAFYLYGVSPSDNHWIVSRALYEMFDFIYDKMPYTGASDDYSAAFKEDPYNAAVIWKASPTVISVEVIGDLGTCTHSISGATLTIKKQITTTTTKTITLRDAATFSVIRNSADGYSAGEALEISDSNLVIPLPVEVVERLTLMEKTQLLGRSAYLIFYSYQHQHIKWYQTSAFAGFMSTMTTVMSIVAMVVVTVVTFGNAAAGSAAGITVSTLLSAMLKTALIAGALQLALYIINETVQDVNLKIALTVLATVAAMWAGGAFSGGFNFGTALQLAELATKAADMYTNAQMKKIDSKMKALQSEAEAFSSQYESRTKQFEDLLKGLNTGLDVSATVGLAVDVDDDFLTSADRGFMMSPDQFYSLATTACYNYDTLYTGFFDTCVHKFVRNKKTLGVLETTGEE